ncbi:MAG: hypothetical protein KDJ88_19460 [Bauldia sp.]|nr:hypothetical protein [Bauldia sp.]
MSIEPEKSLLAIAASRQIVRMVPAESRRTARVIGGLSSHMLADIGYVRTPSGIVRPL